MKRVPMGVMLETPSGAFKTLMVDNVGKLEDSVAHMIPEAPSQIAAPICCILLIFILNRRMGLVSLVTIPLGIPFIMGMMRGYSEKMELYLRSGLQMTKQPLSITFKDVYGMIPLKNMAVLSYVLFSVIMMKLIL